MQGSQKHFERSRGDENILGRGELVLELSAGALCTSFP